MGTVLSLSPASKGGGSLDDKKSDGGGGYTAIPNSKNGKPDKSLKRPSVLISALTWKRLVAASAKKKSAKKVNPNPLGRANGFPPDSNNNSDSVAQRNHENLRKSQVADQENSLNGLQNSKRLSPRTGGGHNGSKHLGTQDDGGKQNGSSGVVVPLSPRRVVVQASTGELLRCLGEFVCRRCYRLKELTPGELIAWFRGVDRSLLLQGWQDQGFITPANLVFVYLLCREALSGDELGTAGELRAAFLTCLYLAYSYMGNEISYPLKPFLVQGEGGGGGREGFWERCLRIIQVMSGPMLRINADPHYFTQVFQDLKGEGEKQRENQSRGENRWTISLDR
ncbi:cyclin-dependent kinase 5 activator 2 [Ambystoma mexicanum]|uniref:cyclin-dependent kinase 5 activator 2 n=1 Tax=Ambystoma mexicanum TaxID=8296 RepID=UPI0037E8FCC4